jgi:hypothetical protein
MHSWESASQAIAQKQVLEKLQALPNQKNHRWAMNKNPQVN